MVWRGVGRSLELMLRGGVELRGDLHRGEGVGGAVGRAVRRGGLRLRPAVQRVVRIGAREGVERRGRGLVGVLRERSGREVGRRGGRCAAHERAQGGQGGRGGGEDGKGGIGCAVLPLLLNRVSKL